MELARVEREVEVGVAEQMHEDRPTLASGIADAAAAQLLIFDELPEDERPRPGDRVLLVGIVWGGTTLVELEQVASSTCPSRRCPRTSVWCGTRAGGTW